VPPEVRTWAWYGVPYGPPASVRSTVAPGTLASAAALTLAATSLESCSRCGRPWVDGVPEDEVPDAAGLSAAPAMAAPPRPSVPKAATVIADLRMVSSKVLSLVGFRVLSSSAGLCESAGERLRAR
jgi:hypothetical protein